MYIWHQQKNRLSAITPVGLPRPIGSAHTVRIGPGSNAQKQTRPSKIDRYSNEDGRFHMNPVGFGKETVDLPGPVWSYAVSYDGIGRYWQSDLSEPFFTNSSCCCAVFTTFAHHLHYIFAQQKLSHNQH